MNLIEYDIISSGSAGNAVVLNKIILIDCGVAFKALRRVCGDLRIVLLTHIHSDHFKESTIRRLSFEKPTLRFGCCKYLATELLRCGVSKNNMDIYEIGGIYNYGAFMVSPIKLYHDVPNCGYRLKINGKKILYVTDTGHLEGIRARNYDLYMIEANYEEDEIQRRIKEKQESGLYSYEIGVVKRHLSKEQADSFILENAGDKSEYCYIHEHIE